MPGQSVSDVVMVLPSEGEPVRYEGAHLHADDATVLIRQKRGDFWTTTAVWAPGTYRRAWYASDDALAEHAEWMEAR